MSQNEEAFTAEEKRELAVKAVNRLIADAEESASFRRYVVSAARCAKIKNSLKSSRSAFARRLCHISRL
jgi:hypothetical protein